MPGPKWENAAARERARRPIRFLRTPRGVSRPNVDPNIYFERLATTSLGKVIGEAALAGIEEDKSTHAARVEGFIEAVRILAGNPAQNVNQDPYLDAALAEAQARIAEVVQEKQRG